jgi:hypothetical protein
VVGEGYASFYLILLISPSISMLSLEEDAHASWITVQNARHATPDQGSCGPPTRQITMHVSPDNVL